MGNSAMNSRVSRLLRSRRILTVVLVPLLLVTLVFHASSRHPIALLSSQIKNDHARYLSLSETIGTNLFVSDIQIRPCLRGFSCRGPSGDTANVWEKVPTKLNLYPNGFSLFNYYMYVEKSKGTIAERFVVDVAFTVADHVPTSKVSGSKWLKHKITAESYIWLNYLDNNDFAVPTVRDVSVLFGKQDLKDSREHWKFDHAPIPIPGRYSIQAKLSILRIAVADEMNIMKSEHEFESVLKKNEILTTSKSNFKLVQISDLHIGQDYGVCYEKCRYDVDTLKFIKSTIEKEKDVSLFMITGDMIDYKQDVHIESVVLKALSPILESRIPFIFTFGESDFDPKNPSTQLDILQFISSLPGCYNKKPQDVDWRLSGLTNGSLKIYQVPEQKEKESFDYNTLRLDEAKAVVTYLHSQGRMISESQASYLHRLSHKLNKNLEQKLLFFHYPLPNFRPSGKIKLIGSYNEKHPLNSNTDASLLDDVKASGYKAVAVGHEHENDACIWDENDGNTVLLCYSGVAGQSAMTKLDQDHKRRLRVFLFDFKANKILSWKRDQDRSFDPQEIWSQPRP